MKNILKNKGFTLLELIIYIAIASVVLVSAIGIGWNIMIEEERSANKRELYMDARGLVGQMTRDIRGAEDVIVGDSTFDVHPGVLSLDYPGGNTDKIFETYSKSVTVGGESVDITKVKYTDGMNDVVALTSDRVDVTNFVVTNMTRGSENPNIKIDITLESVNPGGDPILDASITIETAVSLRQ